MPITSIEDLRSRERLLSGQSKEFAKLSATDKLICLDVIENNRVELKIWLVYTSRDYTAFGIQIDVDKLIEDINRFKKYIDVVD